ncbi:MAG: 3-dehydroquinate synthase II [Candidatus Hadarchaeales archaeon]
MRKLLWVKADWDLPWEEKAEFVKKAVECGADAIIVKGSEVSSALCFGSALIVSQEDRPGVGVVLVKFKDLETTEKELSNLKSAGRRTAVLVEVFDKKSEQVAIRLAGLADFILVTAKSWEIIPLENIIAALQKTGAKLLAEVKSAEKATIAAQILEIGVDGVVLDPLDLGPEEIEKTCRALDALTKGKLALSRAKVFRVQPAGLGDRACIDTTSFMSKGEGMLVGSQSNGLFLVHSETLPSEFVEQRPFRVNAGAVHSYLMIPGGKTKYMTELKAGDEVLIVDHSGNFRPAVVGRVKIERRPLVLVEAEAGGKVYKVLLQLAETINLVGAGGEPLPVTRLKPGDEVLVYVEEGGRHFGMKVEETVVEK